LGYIVYSNLLAGKKTSGASPPAAAEKEAVEEKAAVAVSASAGSARTYPVLSAEQRARQREIDAEPWGRNPFKASPTPVPELGGEESRMGFVLSGVFPAAGGGVAIVNGQDLKVGETMLGYELVEVGASFVTFSKNGNTFTISLPEE
nr:hypothetical protein [bacterium]